VEWWESGAALEHRRSLSACARPSWPRTRGEDLIALLIAMKPPVEETTRVADASELSSDRAESGSDRAYVTVLAGKNVGEMHRVEGAEMVLGRSSSAEVQLLDDGVSRRHARILQIGSEIVIEDLKSSNGTHVNGEPINVHTLHDGDTIRLGSTTVLKFSYHDGLDERFQQQMYEAALRDPLTKAYNRKFLLDRLETELAHARRHASALSLLMFDVDHFKQVNDTFGHVAGDVVLTGLSSIAQAAVRAEDVFARYGGEEFAVLCRGVTLSEGGALGERLRASVEAHAFEHEGRRIPVTISVGVSAYPEVPSETGVQLVAAADEALYQAKRCGRNRVLVKQ
jgi:diguanylate cyclase (GGDEF)-like protein